jgi:glycosyltransferase involved in cell wall biosynthesis
VLIVVQNLPVPLDRRVWSECQTLVAAGYRPSVICPRGGPDDRAVETLQGVRIHRYRPTEPGKGFVGFAHECAAAWLRIAWLSMWIYALDPFEVLQACNPPDTVFPLARCFKALGVRFVYDQHDLVPEIYQSRFERDRGVGLSLLLYLENRTYRAADHVISTNESYRRTACRRGRLPADRVTVVRSGPDPGVMRRGPCRPELRRGRAHLCCYLGVMGHQDRVDLLIRAIDHYVHRLGRDDCHFALLGFGDCYEQLRQLAADLDLEDWITFTGRVDLPVIDAYLSTAELGLAPDPKTPFNDVSSMNKVVEYLAYGLPVVSFDLTETAVSLGGAGVLVANDEVGAFGEAIASLLDDPARREAMGREGRARVESTLGWHAQAPAYQAVYDDLTLPRGLTLVEAPS